MLIQVVPLFLGPSTSGARRELFRFHCLSFGQRFSFTPPFRLHENSDAGIVIVGREVREGLFRSFLAGHPDPSAEKLVQNSPILMAASYRPFTVTCSRCCYSAPDSWFGLVAMGFAVVCGADAGTGGGSPASQ